MGRFSILGGNEDCFGLAHLIGPLLATDAAVGTRQAALPVVAISSFNAPFVGSQLLEIRRERRELARKPLIGSRFAICTHFSAILQLLREGT